MTIDLIADQNILKQGRQRSYVDCIRVHPSYYDPFVKDFNLAVVTLRRPLSFSNKFSYGAACLPKEFFGNENSMDGPSSVDFIGLQENTLSITNKYSLRKTETRHIPFSKCRYHYPDITNNMICITKDNLAFAENVGGMSYKNTAYQNKLHQITLPTVVRFSPNSI